MDVRVLFRRLAIGLALVGGLLLGPWGWTGGLTFAQTAGWGEPVRLSTNTISAWFPDVAVDNQGRAHIVWHGSRKEGEDVLDLLMYAAWDGETYSEPNDIIFTGVGGWTIRPAIAADSLGKLHLVYRDGTDIYYSQAPADAAWSAASWGTPHLVSEGSSAYYSDIAVDDAGVIHVVWNEQPSETEGGRVVWIGTTHGISRIEGETLLPDESQPWAGEYTVYAMLEDTEGRQWFGTSLGVGRYDGVTWEWLTTDDGVAGNEVYAIARDVDRTLWFCTDGGISRYDPLQPQEQRWTTVAVVPELAPFRLQAIVVDGTGDVWLGTSGGLGRYNGLAWEVYRAGDGLTSENITAMAVDYRGTLWVGTDEGVIQRTDRGWVHFTTADGLIGNRVTALVVDSSGVLWIGTGSGLTRYDGVAWRSFTSADGLADDHVTALAVDSGGYLWIGTEAGLSRYDGEEWRTYTAEDGLVDGYITAIAGDSTPNAMCPQCMDIFYRRSEDGGRTWSAPVNLSNSYAGSVKPQIKIDANGGLHVTWEEGEDWYTGAGYPVGSVHRYSPDGGETWAEPFMFTHPDGAPQQITLGVGPGGELVAVWRLPLRFPERSAVYYQWSFDNGASWSDPLPIDGIIAKDWLPMSLDSAHCASDSTGNVHLLVLGYLHPWEEDLSLLYTVWNGEEWSEPYRLYTSANPPEWPRIAIGAGGEIHATWFTRDEAHIWESERGRYQVWAASMETGVSSFPAPATPTSVPTAPPALVTPRMPTPTPFPTIPPDSAPPRGIYTDWDDVSRLAVALAPLMVLIGVSLVVRALRRK